MKITVDGIIIEYQNKLENRKAEVIEFARELCEDKKTKHVKIWETKRHDLAGVYLKQEVKQ